MIQLSEIEKDIRKELINFVKIGDNNKSFVRYKPLAEQFDIPFSNEYERDQLYHMLGNISEHEFEQDRPLLSVIVVNEEFIPGKGFFSLAKRVGKMKPEEDTDRFSLKERKELFEFWKNKGAS